MTAPVRLLSVVCLFLLAAAVIAAAQRNAARRELAAVKRGNVTTIEKIQDRHPDMAKAKP